jgi:hypothetical protein
MTAGWRYHALRILDRQWLHRDLPLQQVAISPALSGPGAMAATLDPDTMGLLADDGTPLLEEWRDLIVAEADDVVRFAGILVNSDFTGESWALDIAGITAWPQGQPQVKTIIYGSEDNPEPGGPVSGEGADPIQIVKDLWTQLQGQPDADLGVTFGGDSVCKHRLARWYNVPNKYDYHPDASTTVEVVPYGDGDLASLKTTDLVKVVVSGTAFTKTLKKTQNSGTPAAKPLYWLHHVYDYENTDLGEKINTYAQASPFDYVEYAEWADSAKSDVVLRVDFGYPRVGTRKAGLRFVEGENVSQLITVRRDGEDYANGVMAVGAGEGADQLRQTVIQRDGRLRRLKVVTASDITDASALKNLATAELNLVNELVDIEGFTVTEHPHAPYGSYGVGDDVPVQVTTGWAAGTRLWVRVTALTYNPDAGSVDVSCKRSDSFSYGSVSVT